MPLNNEHIKKMLGEEVNKSEYYLSLIKGWEDPNPEPVIELHDGIHVVRDDLLGNGAKVRFIDFLIKHTPEGVDEWVYGSSPRWGYGQISLSYACKKYGKKCTLFLPESNELHPNSQRAKDNGAKIIMVPVGFMKVCEARSREYIAEHKKAKLVPFGLVDDTIYGSIIKVARSLPIVPASVVTVAGSGTLNRGLQMAWPNAECHMVSVGHVLTDDEIANAIVYRHSLKFAQKCKKGECPPFPSVGEYDAKGYLYAKGIAEKNQGRITLFWNVGA